MINKNISRKTDKPTFNMEEAVLGVAATLAFEGFESSEEDLSLSRKILSGEIDVEEYIKSVIKNFKGDNKVRE